MAKYSLPRGTRDFIGFDAEKAKLIEDVITEVVRLYGYREIRTPIFEYTEVFTRSVGESSDIVNKEMYTFLDRGDRSMTLRPEGTAGVVRAYVDSKLYANPDTPHKYYYYGPIFRYERPQAGRYRQLHQFGIEALGVRSAYLDAEQIIMISDILRKLGIEKYSIRVNSIGDDEARTRYKDALKVHFEPHLGQLCADCNRRYMTNPLRILDCKIDAEHVSLKTAPPIHDYLSVSSQQYFEQFLTLLSDYNVPYIMDTSLVRGLDYYCDVVYEIDVTSKSGKDYGAVGGGGRYDPLVEIFGGPATPACGFAFGLDRLGLILAEEGIFDDFQSGLLIQVVPLEEKVYAYAYDVCNFLRANGIEADINYEIKTLKASFKTLDRKNIAYALIIGDDEMQTMTVMVKDNKSKEQEPVLVRDLISYFSKEEIEHSHECECEEHDHDCHENCNHDH